MGGALAAAVLTLVIAWVVLGPTADWLARHDVGSVKGPLLQTARDAARGRLLTLGAGLFAAGALLFTARNFVLSREGQMTDRYTKAIEQLGSDKLDVRIGGIYALERIARDSKKDHPTVMEVLTAFIREHSHELWPLLDPDGAVAMTPSIEGTVATSSGATRRIAAGLNWLRFKQAASRIPSSRAGPAKALTDKPLAVGSPKGVSVRPNGSILTGAERHRPIRRDVQAAVTVIGRRDAKRDIGLVDLTYAKLTGADLAGARSLAGAKLVRAILVKADLSHANLSSADLALSDLTGADLSDADLSHANIGIANLTDAFLSHANLTDAHLGRANLTHALLLSANLNEAYLSRANLTGATLVGADLTGADLRSANLTDADLTGATSLMRDFLGGTRLTGADLTGADLTGAYWPADAPVPEGWKLDANSGRLVEAKIGSGPTGQDY